MGERARRRVLVVGGGISGLAAAHRLIELDPSLAVEVWEKSASPGGWLRTTERDGFEVELGPDSILTEKPAALSLAKRVGIEDRVISTLPENRGAYVVARGRLERVPEGFSLLAPVDVPAFLESPIVSLAAKARAGLDVMLPRRAESLGDESLGEFVRRRFGSELLDRLAQPLASGIYGSDPDALSLSATMPRFTQMEASERSVFLALRKRARAASAQAASGARYGLFAAFRGGMQVLVDALARSLGSRLRTGIEARSLERTEHGYRALHASGASEHDAVIVALPGPHAARLLEPVDAPASRALSRVHHASAATVTLAYRREDVPHALDAYGFVVPAVERREILASTWASAKWPGRAPEGHALIRVFLGGSHDADVAERDDADLIAAARRELGALMGIAARPLFTMVMRYPRAMPQYAPGHASLLRTVRERETRALAIAGNSVAGVGIPDAIANGERAAELIAGR